MLRKPTNLVILLVVLLGALVLVSTARATEAQATRPALPPHSMSEAKQIRWCHFRHRGDYQGKAACTTRVAWTGNWRRGKEAVRVGWCESGLNHTRGVATGATYQGAWQFDADARRTYRWGYSLVEQVAATVRITDARGWQPFPQCKPRGSAHARKWREAPSSVRMYG